MKVSSCWNSIQDIGKYFASCHYIDHFRLDEMFFVNELKSSIAKG